MHAKVCFIFWLTLGLYLVTLFTVSYVGVYLTYIAIPILVISGIIMICTKPKPERKKIIKEGKSVLRQVGQASNDVLEASNGLIDGLNNSLGKYNEVNEMVRERTSAYKDKIQSLRLEKIPLKSSLKYSESHIEKSDLKNKIEHINKEIEINEKSIEQIRHACELEVNAP